MRMRKAFRAWIEDRQFLRAHALEAVPDRWRDE